MDKKLYIIQQKIGSIQFGLLRVMHEGSKMTLQVKAVASETDSFNCQVTDDSPGKKLVNKNVNLIQKSHNDYLYISGQVNEEINKKGRIFSIRILKACWFVRRSKGSVSWLQEKYTYEKLTPEVLELAS